MRDIGVGVIGTGFMGKAHSFAYRAVAGIFPGSLRPVLQSVADINGGAAEQAAKQFGFLRWRTDWRALVEDPDIEVVSITTPNVVHREMALAAVAAGKHVHCEKPIAPNADAAKDMMDAAEAAGIVTQVGYNYIKNPMLKLARSMVAAGELGEITGAKGSLVYTQERLNELLHYRTNGDPRQGGYTRIEAGPQHHPYGLFCVAPGHQLGFNDLKTIEVAEFLEAIAGGERRGPDFREAWEIQRIIDTAVW